MLKASQPTHQVRLDLSQCTELYLAFQKITSVEAGLWNRMSRLKKLNLSFNRMHHIDKSTFSGLNGLEELILMHNSISIIEPDSFAHMTQLRKLDFSFNCLEHIKAKMFAGLHNLEWLSLDFNVIKLIDNDSFSQMPKLVVLKLCNHMCQKPFNMSCLSGLSNKLEEFVATNAEKIEYDLNDYDSFNE